MAQKKKCRGIVSRHVMISKDIYSMWIKVPKDNNIAMQAVPGQFISMYSSDGSRLLPRPISICEIYDDSRILRVVYRVVGKGTEEFSKLKEGHSIDIVGPLGNGFTLKEGKSLLIGGGIGIPPMLELAKQLKGEVSVVLGYRDNDLFLSEEFKKYANLYISTEDGSVGTKGNVIDAIKANNIEADNIFACGPIPMLKGVKEYAVSNGIKAQISMEEKMACGIGACLGCVCQSKEKDSHSNVNNKRVCKDGPVFDAEEIEL